MILGAFYAVSPFKSSSHWKTSLNLCWWTASSALLHSISNPSLAGVKKAFKSPVGAVGGSESQLKPVFFWREISVATRAKTELGACRGVMEGEGFLFRKQGSNCWAWLKYSPVFDPWMNIKVNLDCDAFFQPSQTNIVIIDTCTVFFSNNHIAYEDIIHTFKVFALQTSWIFQVQIYVCQKVWLHRKAKFSVVTGDLIFWSTFPFLWSHVKAC